MQLRATRLTAIASAVKRAISAFNVRSLFASGAQGVWYDPSDMSTLFQDSAGTTPVTAVEQPVGLMLDKSQGLVLGSELVTNGDFSNGTTGWTPNGCTQQVVGNELEITTIVPGFIASDATITTVVGKTYKYTANVRRNQSSGNARITVVGLIDGSSITSLTPTSVSIIFTAASTTTTIRLGAFNAILADKFSYSVASVKELPGNHAFQATSASRPVLSARYNLLTKTEDFSNAAWVKSASPAVTLTDQGAGVWRLQAAAGAWLLYQTLAQAAGVNCTVSFEVKSNGTGADTFRLMLQGTILTSNQTATNEWVRYSLTNTNAGSGSAGIISSSSATAIDVLIRFPSLVVTAQAPAAYQRVNTASDYNTTGFLPYLKFDGVDDSLSTNSISFTSTDKMSVFAGVRKLNTSSSMIVVELSQTMDTNNGTFNIQPFTDSKTYFASKGSIYVAAGSNTYSQPATDVLTGFGDISGDRATLRVNGAQVAQNTGDQGTGNYGNYPLFIGRRNNASFPFNGQIYSMIIVGKAVTAGELSSTETFVASKTGVTL